MHGTAPHSALAEHWKAAWQKCCVAVLLQLLLLQCHACCLKGADGTLVPVAVWVFIGGTTKQQPMKFPSEAHPKKGWCTHR